MSDKLKKRIEEDRSSFKVYKGDYDSWWNDIEKKMDKAEIKEAYIIPWKTLFRVAASILLVMTVSIGFLWLRGNSVKYADGISLQDLSPELAEAEVYYNQMVEAKMGLIKASNVTLDPMVVRDFELLDSAYNELKLDLEDNMYNQEVIDAMIQNYRIKLQVLENILDEIQKTNEDEENDEEAISI